MRSARPCKIGTLQVSPNCSEVQLLMCMAAGCLRNMMQTASLASAKPKVPSPCDCSWQRVDCSAPWEYFVQESPRQSVRKIGLRSVLARAELQVGHI